MEEFTIFNSQANQCHLSHINISTTMDTRHSKLTDALPKIPSPLIIRPQTKITHNFLVSVKNKKLKNQKAEKTQKKQPKSKKITKKPHIKSQKNRKPVEKPKLTLKTFFNSSKSKIPAHPEKINLAPKNPNTDNLLKTPVNKNKNSKVTLFRPFESSVETPSSNLPKNKQTNIDVINPRSPADEKRTPLNDRKHQQLENPQKSRMQINDWENSKSEDPLPHKMEIETDIRIPRLSNPFQFNILPIAKQNQRNLQLSEQKKNCLKERLELEKELTHRFKIIRALGKGSFATVFLVEDKTNSQRVAIKVYKKNTPTAERQIQIIENEVRILRILNHDKIVKFISQCESEKHVILVLELIPGITLSSFLHKNSKKRLPEMAALKVFQQIVGCLQTCHSRNIYHRDIKLSNVMIQRSLDIVLIDFGFAVENPKADLLSTFCGTLNYIAPELLKNRPYKPGPVDIWAFGILLFKLLTGEYPFKGRLIS